MLHSQSQMELQDTARLPLVIREADIEYQLHRLTLFSRLTQVHGPLIAVTSLTHPVTRPIPPILKESMLFFRPEMHSLESHTPFVCLYLGHRRSRLILLPDPTFDT